MAKRFIDTDLFRKPLLRSLQAPYKVLWIYLLCECDHAGVWDVELDVAAMRLGPKFDEAKCVAALGSAIVPIDGGRKWWLPEFVAFQYGTLNPANKVHASVLAILSKYGIDPLKEAPSEELTSPLQGAKDKDMDKAMDTDKENSLGKEPAREFEPAWAAYGRYGNKLAAFSAWAKLTNTDRDAVLAAVPAYVNVTSTDGTFPSRKHFATYLNGRAWEDELPKRGTSRAAAMEKALHSADVPADKYQEGI